MKATSASTCLRKQYRCGLIVAGIAGMAGIGGFPFEGKGIDGQEDINIVEGSIRTSIVSRKPKVMGVPLGPPELLEVDAIIRESGS